MPRSVLYVRDILAWADDFKKRVGRWPHRRDGRVSGVAHQTWYAVDQALKAGFRGLPGGQSLARLLFERRGKRHKQFLPRLSLKQFLAWADAHHHRTGQWPTFESGRIVDARGETWSVVDKALRKGLRGLRGAVSLLRLLEERRGVPVHRFPMTPNQVLAWADAHFQRTGRWPTATSGTIPESPRPLTWLAVTSAFAYGARGLAGHGTLPQFLAERRGVRNMNDLPKLSVRKILAWADSYHRRAGKWPTLRSGPIPEALGETWCGINSALYVAGRGLPGGSLLYRLLLEHNRRSTRVQARGGKVAAGR
jgi:hypothetical protein